MLNLGLMHKTPIEILTHLQGHGADSDFMDVLHSTAELMTPCKMQEFQSNQLFIWPWP